MDEFPIVRLTVNNKRYRVPGDPGRSLLDYLRNDLGLTGAKNGCDQKGVCGACTVIVNGKAAKSCQLKLSQLDNAHILTVEGLTNGKSLHPLQEAFIREGAVQCGFCTPGMIMASKALLDENPHPTRDDIVAALRGNLCRCGTYKKVITAVQRVAEDESEKTGMETEAQVDIGAPLIPKMAEEKVTGRLKFAADLPVTDTTFAKIVWPRFPHAKIKKVDISQAVALPGVIAVLTAKDVPGQNAFGGIRADQPVLAEDRVRYLGDPVALVIATSRVAAEQGRDLVEVEYQALDPVYDPQEALVPNAPHLFQQGNLVCKFSLKRGQIEEGFRRSDIVVEGRFSTPAVEHAYMEPEAGIGEWDEGKVTIRAACQYPQTIQRQIATVLDLPVEMVRVISHPTGGAFGGKTDISIHALLALGAFITHRRVRIVLSREESLRTSVKRHPMILDYRMGLRQDGHIEAISGSIVANCGAYETFSIPVIEQATAFATGPYTVPHVSIESRGAFTNTPPSSAFRGFGIPQPTFAVESLLDEAARKLQISPLEIRRINAVRQGERTVTEQLLGPDTHLVEALDAIEQDYVAAQQDVADRPGWGVGIACGYKNVGLGLGERDYANAEIEVLSDGKILLRVGAIDLGQGSSTILAQIAAHALGVSYADIDVEMGDTANDPDARETNASRQTVMSGNAVLRAVESLKKEIARFATIYYPQLRENMAIEGRNLIGRDGSRIELAALAESVHADGKRLLGKGMYLAPQTVPLGTVPLGQEGEGLNYPTFGFFANLAIVRVDKHTGRVSVEKLVSAYDVGKAINRLTLEGQIEGGAIMGMGYALSEKFVDHGPNQTSNLAQCGVPRIDSLPTKLDARLIEEGDSLGPYGAKGVGEMAMVAVAPAITNAIYDACQVRIVDLPASADKIRRATEMGVNA